MEKTVIMISGNINHGKDYLADLLVKALLESGFTAEKISTARVIKEVTCTLFGIKPEHLDNLKNTKEPVLLPNNYGVFNFRTFLQRFGTEIKKISGEHVWAETLREDISKSNSDYIIVPDLRYPFERDIVAEKFKTYTVRIFNNDIVPGDTHHSETSMIDYEFDILVNNTGRPDLVKDVENILNEVTFYGW